MTFEQQIREFVKVGETVSFSVTALASDSKVLIDAVHVSGLSFAAKIEGDNVKVL